MSVATVKARLAAIQATISGVRRAYAYGPASLPPGDLPAFVNFTGAGTPNVGVFGRENNRESRIYLMRLHVKPVGQGIDGEIERLVEPFLVSVRDAFAGRPSLALGTADPDEGPLAGVYQAILQGDNGVAVFTYAGEQYLGVEWRLEVIELIDVDFAAYE